MHRIILFLAIPAALAACTPTPYCWQDTRQPQRENVAGDLQECRDYTAAQYRPGVPAGTPYLEQQQRNMHGLGFEDVMENVTAGEWRPDRDPTQAINSNHLSTHEVKVDHTGYPGELDYYPGYLDDILEKCMGDRGWIYAPVTGEGCAEEESAQEKEKEE